MWLAKNTEWSRRDLRPRLASRAVRRAGRGAGALKGTPPRPAKQNQAFTRVQGLGPAGKAKRALQQPTMLSVKSDSCLGLSHTVVYSSDTAVLKTPRQVLTAHLHLVQRAALLASMPRDASPQKQVARGGLESRPGAGAALIDSSQSSIQTHH
ncbi:hypothetical protein CB1_000849068 [Camelus ferus]|nr:hypothetical protein CB1_000849068 [Camelus ferus]